MANSFTQSDFSGGLNLLHRDAIVQNNQYTLLINGRSRFGYVRPIKKPLKLTSAPAGKKQGIYAVGDILVLFCAGKAYFKLQSSDTWTAITGFSFDPTVEYVYAALVPAGIPADRSFEGDDITKPVTKKLSDAAPSNGCLVCQDGVNQPRLIFADGSSREARKWSDWSAAIPEYVPIGKQMMFFDGILYIVAPDGKSIYRSVSGRPLDFMVPVDINGAKITDVDATDVSFSVDFNKITCIAPLNTESFLVSTAYSCYAVTPDYDNTVYGEPTFSQTPLFTAGVVNQFSVVDILGDFAFIDFEGIKSFNAVNQLKNEGNNSVFSLTIASLFEGIIQSTCCATVFDNYAYFSVKTTHGHTVVVYDTIRKVFDSLEFTAASRIKMFATTFTSSEQKLYAITAKDEVFQIHGDSAVENCILRTKAWTNQQSANIPYTEIYNHKPTRLKAVFEDCKADGTVYAVPSIDGLAGATIHETQLKKVQAGVNYPVSPPVIASNADTVQQCVWPLKGLQGYKVLLQLKWNTDAKLAELQVNSVPDTSMNTAENKSRVYA